MKRLPGKSAIITGAAHSVGRAFAQASVQENATVAIADINIAAAEQMTAAHGPRTYAVQLDIKDWLNMSEAVWGTLVSLTERG
jgi:galactitol 2-dehydrogenase